MPDGKTKADLAAEKAHADAAAQPEAGWLDAHPEKPAPVVKTPAPASKPIVKAQEPVEASTAPKPEKAEAAADPAKLPPVRKPKPVASKPARRAAIKAKPVSAKLRPAASKPVGSVPAKKIAAARIKTAPAATRVSQSKESIMATINTDPKAAFADVQDKAKAAYAKGTEVFGELTEFTKGNVEAVVASSKILGSGLQELGTAYVADGKAAIETLTAEVKELAAVKSPVDFFKLQGEIMRRNFDASLAFASKNSEALLKLTNEAVAPISGRVSLAVEKVRKAA